MSKLNLYRISTNDPVGTFGVLKWSDRPAPFAVTCEDAWLNNQAWVSCIPEGDYICRRVDSPKFGDTFQVMDVPGRTHILFHKGNTHHNTNGCILVGESFSHLDGLPSIAHSGQGYGEFMGRLQGIDEFELNIMWAGLDV